MIDINNFSNWNKYLSGKEIKILDELANDKIDLSFFNEKDLLNLKEILIKQFKSYSSRENISDKSRKYIKELTFHAISSIYKALDKKENSFWLEKEFPTIENTNELKKLFIQKLITKNDVEKWLRRWYRTIRLHYRNWYTDKVSVKELKKFYDEVIKAQEYSKNSINEGIKKSKDGNINYKATSTYAKNYDETHKEKLTWLSKLISKAQVYMWAMEKWNDPLSKELQEKMKKFWLDIKNNPTDNWCAAFVWQVLIDSWYYENIRSLKNKLSEPYPDVASLYLWAGYFKAHIWIYTWWDIMINWNSHNMVRYSKIDYSKLVWWVLPDDIWDPEKVHWYRKEKWSIPPWAILVFKRWRERLSYNIRKKAWWVA